MLFGYRNCSTNVAVNKYKIFHKQMNTKQSVNKKTSVKTEVLIFIKRLQNYAFGSTDTKDLLFAFFLKTTLPSTNANKV